MPEAPLTIDGVKATQLQNFVSLTQCGESSGWPAGSSCRATFNEDAYPERCIDLTCLEPEDTQAEGQMETVASLDANRSIMMSSAPRFKQMVLVVEDELILRNLATEIVREAGFEAIEATNADEAVLILETHTDIRIVFTDIDMPGSLDGMKLAACIRDRWPPIEIILTSGHGLPMRTALPPRAQFIAKPYQVSNVVRMLKQLAA